MNINYKKNISSLAAIKLHLEKASASFRPRLDSYVDIGVYSKKIFNKTERIEAIDLNNNILGLIAYYINNGKVFITNYSVIPEIQNTGVGRGLFTFFKNQLENVNNIELEVYSVSSNAIKFYKHLGFYPLSDNGGKITMGMKITRNYNREFDYNTEREYAYNFDFDVMHSYMLKSFLPFFRKGALLELGCFMGSFTQRLTPYFEDITCVEASSEAISVAKNKLPENVKFLRGTFEDIELNQKYDNIVLTHVLEHLDDPVSVLKRIRNEWLAENGRLFLVCPNANAPSRQIAVHMGLISHNSAVTDAERKHGHRITYSFDTLERDVKQADLNIVHKSGIFFKALANFQWDQLLNTDIISKEYLDGCYELGKEYPNLCSSIFFVCENDE